MFQPTPLDRSLQRRPAPGPLRAAEDPVAETEADAVADAVTRRIGERPGLRPVGGRLPAPVSDAVRQELGAAPDIRVHHDALSSRLADSVSARAFTAGTDIHLAAGEGGTHLLAHEAAHATLHAQPGAGIVHAKLSGTRNALKTKGGTASVGAKMSGKGWDAILSALASYERTEARQKPGVEPAGHDRKKMLKLLDEIEAAATGWQSQHGSVADAEAPEAQWKTGKKKSETWHHKDKRAKAPRAQSLAMLLPRVRAERRALLQGTWSATATQSDANAILTGDKKQGGKNEVTEVTYGAGGVHGYFKADQGFGSDGVREHHERNVGIGIMDPNYGSRAVAMTRLNDLLGLDVQAASSFATLNGQMGTVIEASGGTEAKKVAQVMAGTSRAGGGQTLALDDPLLQRKLNQLQWLDALSGQLDRHTDNFHLNLDAAGTVTGVKGIDPDMAFGRHMNDPNAYASENYKRVPDLVDGQVAQRILALDASDIQGAIGDLLHPAEVAATVARLQALQGLVAQAQQDGRVVTKWGEATFRRQVGTDASLGGRDATTYLQFLALVHVGRVTDELVDAVETGSRDAAFLTSVGLDGTDPNVIASYAYRFATGGLAEPMGEGLLRGDLDEAEARRRIPRLVRAIFADPGINGTIRATQTNVGASADKETKAVVQRFSGPLVVPAALPRLPATPAPTQPAKGPTAHPAQRPRIAGVGGRPRPRRQPGVPV